MLPARRFNGQYGISDFFNDFFDNRSLEKMGNMTPAINVMENDKGYLLELAAPGMCKDDFKVHLNKDGNLVIEMEKTDCCCKDKGKDKEEDRKSLPDYKHFEIKTKKYGSKSYTTLFNLTPNNDSDKNEIKRLVEKYGYPDKVLKNKKVLQNEIYFTNKTLIGNRYYFKLTIKKEKLYISVYYKNNILKEEIAYWNIYELYERLQKKLTYLVVVNAIKYTKNNIDFYKYYNYDFYRLKNERTFIDLIKDGKIRVKLKIGIYRDGPKKGQIHDHGTSFEIDEVNIEKLYIKYVRIN